MTTARDSHPVQQGFAIGATFIAGVLLFVVSALGLFQGISAVVNDNLFVVGSNYVYKFNLTTWGWIHIIISVIGLLIAIGLFAGATWARASAIVLLAVSIVANFLWIPYYPWWSILLIALDAFVIWAIATWNPGRDAAA